MEFAFVLEYNNLFMQLAVPGIIAAVCRLYPNLSEFGAVFWGDVIRPADLFEIGRVLIHADVGKRRGTADGKPVLTRRR